MFTKVDYSLGTLISQISMGSTGLPDIQRPFVWAPAKVRDLFDSMYRGYPVGHMLLWESGAEPGAKQIGTDGKLAGARLRGLLLRALRPTHPRAGPIGSFERSFSCSAAGATRCQARR